MTKVMVAGSGWQKCRRLAR